MTILCRLTGLTLLCAALASPQTKWPLRRIAIEGNKTFSDRQLIAATGLKLGEPVGQGELNAGQRRLLDTGVLESVAFQFGPAPGGDGYVVTYKVAEIQQVYELRFENIGAPDEELAACLARKDPLFAPKLPGTERLIDRYEKWIEECLAGKGIDTEIRGEVTADRPEELYIMFHPKGAMPIVAEVDFVGNTLVPTERLRESIHGVAVGSRFTEGRFRILLSTSIRPIYAMRGRVDVQFTKIETEPLEKVNGVKVTVTIEEGETYNFANVTIEGAGQYGMELRHAANIKSGDIANMVEVLNGMERIKAVLFERGYLKATAEAQRALHRESKEVDIVITVKPGREYSFGKLKLEGLDVHGEYEIKRVWGMVAGEKYDPTYPEFFLQKVREIGLFDNLEKTEVEIEVDDRAATVDVVLIFNPEERKMRFGTGEVEPDAQGRRKRK